MLGGYSRDYRASYSIKNVWYQNTTSKAGVKIRSMFARVSVITITPDFIGVSIDSVTPYN